MAQPDDFGGTADGGGDVARELVGLEWLGGDVEEELTALEPTMLRSWAKAMKLRACELLASVYFEGLVCSYGID